MTKTRAAVVQSVEAGPVIHDIELAELAPDEVLVRIAATGVCHTDVAWAAGEYLPDYGFPVVLGHESSGTVDAVGSSVTRVRPGDRVVLGLTHHCGHCRDCEAGHPILCEKRTEVRPRHSMDGRPLIQGFGTGGFAEATIVKEVSTIPMPDDVPFDVAAVVGCAVATGLGAVFNIAEVRPGSTVVVFGAGGIGLNVVMGAKIAGAERIVVVDPASERRSLATKLGATDAIAPPGSDDGDALRALEPEGFDYAFESVGRTEPMELAIRQTRRGGTTVLIGATSLDATFTVKALDFVMGQSRILGCLTGDVRPDVDFDRYFRLYRRGLLDLERLVTASLPFSDIGDAFRRSASGEGIRTLVTFPE